MNFILLEHIFYLERLFLGDFFESSQLSFKLLYSINGLEELFQRRKEEFLDGF